MSFNSQLSLILSFSQLSPMRVMGLIECQVSLTKSVHVARGKKIFNKNHGVKFIKKMMSDFFR
jgi:hypothetical protein